MYVFRNTYLVKKGLLLTIASQTGQSILTLKKLLNTDLKPYDIHPTIIIIIMNQQYPQFEDPLKVPQEQRRVVMQQIQKQIDALNYILYQKQQHIAPERIAKLKDLLQIYEGKRQAYEQVIQLQNDIKKKEILNELQAKQRAKNQWFLSKYTSTFQKMKQFMGEGQLIDKSLLSQRRKITYVRTCTILLEIFRLGQDSIYQNDFVYQQYQQQIALNLLMFSIQALHYYRFSKFSNKAQTKELYQTLLKQLGYQSENFWQYVGQSQYVNSFSAFYSNISLQIQSLVMYMLQFSQWMATSLKGQIYIIYLTTYVTHKYFLAKIIEIYIKLRSYNFFEFTLVSTKGEYKYLVLGILGIIIETILMQMRRLLKYGRTVAETAKLPKNQRDIFVEYQAQMNMEPIQYIRSYLVTVSSIYKKQRKLALLNVSLSDGRIKPRLQSAYEKWLKDSNKIEKKIQEENDKSTRLRSVVQIILQGDINTDQIKLYKQKMQNLRGLYGLLAQQFSSSTKKISSQQQKLRMKLYKAGHYLGQLGSQANLQTFSSKIEILKFINKVDDLKAKIQINPNTSQKAQVSFELVFRIKPQRRFSNYYSYIFQNADFTKFQGIKTQDLYIWLASKMKESKFYLQKKIDTQILNGNQYPNISFHVPQKFQEKMKKTTLYRRLSAYLDFKRNYPVIVSMLEKLKKKQLLDVYFNGVDDRSEAASLQAVIRAQILPLAKLTANQQDFMNQVVKYANSNVIIGDKLSQKYEFQQVQTQDSFGREQYSYQLPKQPEMTQSMFYRKGFFDKRPSMAYPHEQTLQNLREQSAEAQYKIAKMVKNQSLLQKQKIQEISEFQNQIDRAKAQIKNLNKTISNLKNNSNSKQSIATQSIRRKNQKIVSQIEKSTQYKSFFNNSNAPMLKKLLQYMLIEAGTNQSQAVRSFFKLLQKDTSQEEIRQFLEKIYQSLTAIDFAKVKTEKQTAQIYIDYLFSRFEYYNVEKKFLYLEAKEQAYKNALQYEKIVQKSQPQGSVERIAAQNNIYSFNKALNYITQEKNMIFGILGKFLSAFQLSQKDEYLKFVEYFKGKNGLVTQTLKRHKLNDSGSIQFQNISTTVTNLENDLSAWGNKFQKVMNDKFAKNTTFSDDFKLILDGMKNQLSKQGKIVDHENLAKIFFQKTKNQIVDMEQQKKAMKYMHNGLICFYREYTQNYKLTTMSLTACFTILKNVGTNVMKVFNDKGTEAKFLKFINDITQIIQVITSARKNSSKCWKGAYTQSQLDQLLQFIQKQLHGTGKQIAQIKIDVQEAWQAIKTYVNDINSEI